MQLRDYLRMLQKRGWVIIVVTIITVASAFVFSKFQTPVYRATIYLNVWPARPDYGLQQTVKGLMRNYANNIRSRATLMDVINRAQLDITPEQMQGKLLVSSIESDFLIQIDVDDYDPHIAQTIAQTTAEVFVEDMTAYMVTQDKTDRIDFSIVDAALPGELHKPKIKINMIAGAIFGLVVGLAAVFVLEWLESDVIRSTDDMERYTGLAVLGTIPTVAAHSTRRHSGPRRATGGTAKA